MDIYELQFTNYGGLTIFVEGKKSEGTRCESTICERTTRFCASLTMKNSALPQKLSDNRYFLLLPKQIIRYFDNDFKD